MIWRMSTVDTEHLERILDRVQEWTRAADTKAEILALMQTATAALLADDFASWFAAGTPAALKLGMALSVGLWIISVVMTAFAILAQTDNPSPKSITFFGDIANKAQWATVEDYRASVCRRCQMTGFVRTTSTRFTSAPSSAATSTGTSSAASGCFCSAWLRWN